MLCRRGRRRGTGELRAKTNRVQLHETVPQHPRRGAQPLQRGRRCSGQRSRATALPLSSPAAQIASTVLRIHLARPRLTPARAALVVGAQAMAARQAAPRPRRRLSVAACCRIYRPTLRRCRRGLAR